MEITVVPKYRTLLDNELFAFETYDPLQMYGVDRLGFATLRDRLQTAGHTITTVDQLPPEDADIVVFIDMNCYYLQRVLSMDNSPRLVYLMREPPSVDQFNTIDFISAHLGLFDRVLSWNDELIARHDRVTGYKLPYCYPEHRYDEGRPFAERNLIVNISGRKTSSHPKQLYSERRRLVEYYDKHHPDKFALYGVGWCERSPMDIWQGNLFPTQYKTHRGLADDKLETYQDFRFAICFENVSGIPGYITEKLFDCFRAGVVPVYWGASNVEEYVPANAFVDYREFESPEALTDHLTGISETEFESYRAAAREFLASPEPFDPDSFGETVADALIDVGTTPRRSVPEGTTFDPDGRDHLDRMIFDPADVSRAEYLRRLLALGVSAPGELLATPQAGYFALRRWLPGTNV